MAWEHPEKPRVSGLGHCACADGRGRERSQSSLWTGWGWAGGRARRGGTPGGVERGLDSQVQKARQWLPGDREWSWAGRQHLRAWLTLGKWVGLDEKGSRMGAGLWESSEPALDRGEMLRVGGAGLGSQEEGGMGAADQLRQEVMPPPAVGPSSQAASPPRGTVSPWGCCMENVHGIAQSSPGPPGVKNLPANAGDVRDVRDAVTNPGSGRTPERGHGHPLQYTCLENPWTEEPGGLQSMGSQKSRT